MSRIVADTINWSTAGTTSDKYYLGGGIPAAIQLPAAWVAGNITFLGSIDGSNFYPVDVADGGADNAYTITTAAAGSKVYKLDPNVFQGLVAIQIVAAAQAQNTKVVIGLRAAN